MLENEITAILHTIDSDQPCLPRTLLYNEGWMLRLLLSAEQQGKNCLPFRFLPGSRWFSEALLYSAFLPRRRGDDLAESCTHADAVSGHFFFDASTKSGLSLVPGAKQFVVCEAKMFSPLSTGTTNAPAFDQAARSVGCMAETLRRARLPVASYESLGFYLFAPQSQIETGGFSAQMSKESVSRRLIERVGQYQHEPAFLQLSRWYENWAVPLIQRMDLQCYAWETVIAAVAAHDSNHAEALKQFYVLCVKFNSSAGAAAAR